MNSTIAKAPLLSVVIPTCERPQFLSRAIDSALQAAPNGDVEVIIVPNGPDESWKSVAKKYRENPRISWTPIETPHANAARNHGMQAARGEYIRFLDDDDYYYPEQAKLQLVNLIEREGDLSFGDIYSVDIETNQKKKMEQLQTDDYYSAVLSPTHSSFPGALVYKRSLTKGLAWDVSVNKNQDVYWAMLLCKSRDMRTVRFDGVVAAWVQHRLPRVSKGHHPAPVYKQTAKNILELVDRLEEKGKLTQERSQSAADYLWKCIHAGIMYDPCYWITIAKRTEKIYPNRNPNTKLYKNKLVRALNPLIVEVLNIPWRWMKVFFGHKYTL